MSKKFGGLGKGLDTIFAENETEDSNSSVMLKISEIEPNRSQPRRDFDENSLSDLAQSISQHGLLQPLLVRPLPIGGYQIVAGERRYRACRMAGLTEVPVTIRELSDTETMELALIENLQREDLSPIEEALGYKALIDEHGFSQEEVATSVGKSRPAIANSLRILKLPDSVLEYVKQDKISAGHARALLMLDNEKICLNLRNLSIKKIYRFVRRKNLQRKSRKLRKILNRRENRLFTVWLSLR